MNANPRVVMVTGAAGNLGRAIAHVFAATGDRLVLVDLNAESLRDSSDGAVGEVLLAPADLLQQEEAGRAVDAALQRFGRIDVLCNVAGGFRMGEAVHETSDSTWDLLFDLNTRTLLHAVRAAVPQMIANGVGKIVNVASFSAQRGLAQMGPYTASKAVVIRLTEAMSGELRAHGINVNCVLPTTLDTPENRRAMPDADPTEWVTPEDLAQVIAFLSSEGARAVHGASIPVTGLG
jgi:NAD(P)-dependent dehydrogenase (short-subunit alcohol dehydrogenase family)